MAEILTLTVPEVPPATTTWSVDDIYVSVSAPSIKVTLVSNLGERFTYRYVVGGDVTEANVRAAITIINQGRFKTQQGKSLQKWLLDRISSDGVKVGTVSGTEI